MADFEVYDLDIGLFSQKMRDVFRSLVDVYEKDTKTGYLKSVPSNYGYVFFWFGSLDDEVLTKYYKNYVSRDKLREVEETRKKSEEEFGVGYFSLSDHIRDELFPIVYAHPDTIGGGVAEVYLAILNVDFKETSIEKIISSLKGLTDKLKKLDEFSDSLLRDVAIDHEINYETITFVDLDASDEEIEALKFGYEDVFEDENYQHIFRKEGWEILIRIDFDGDDTLQDIIERIDTLISPIKPIVNKMVRYETSFSPL